MLKSNKECKRKKKWIYLKQLRWFKLGLEDSCKRKGIKHWGLRLQMLKNSSNLKSLMKRLPLELTQKAKKVFIKNILISARKRYMKAYGMVILEMAMVSWCGWTGLDMKATGKWEWLVETVNFTMFLEMSMRGIGSIANGLGLDFLQVQMALNTKVFGWMTKKTGWEFRNYQMAIFLTVIFKMILNQAKVHIYGKMDHHIRDFGNKICNMGSEFIFGKMVINTLANGQKEKWAVMGFISILMEYSIMASTKII